MMLPLPKRVADLIDEATTGYHPGLALDKHLDPPADAEQQKPLLQRVCSGGSDQKLLDALVDRRGKALAEAIRWIGRTSGSLTLHLSRATALENAGIALHPIYGFVYLPGSGLKGLARSWAERVWLEAQPNREQAVLEIRAIFGYTPNSERGKDWIPPEIARDPHSSAGAVVFHDAWPSRWPKLIVDIVGVHHPKYYQAEEHKVPPPGDWEDPVPTTFLAVSPGTEFEFAVGLRHSEHSNLAQRAAEWLKAALAEWGAGAKTAAGYGRIVSEEPPQAINSPQRRRFECILEVVTPGFLAGAFQKPEDCDLRGATLRGQLRWWWRTLHAGHLEPRLLRRLETAIWGAAGEGGAVQVSLEPVQVAKAESFQGGPAIGYLAYGMRDAGRVRKPAGSKWTLQITARGAEFRRDPQSKDPDHRIPAQAALEEVHAALWLLSRYGGVGAKGRKGFGSLADVPVDGIVTIEDCKKLATALRHKVGLVPGRADFRAPCLERAWVPEPIELRETHPDQALSRLAEAYREFVKSKKMADRTPLGLPRKQSSVDMGPPAGPVKRHPTTIHFHLANSAGGLVLRMAGFEIERIVRGAGLFQEMEAALRRSLGPGGLPGRRRPPARTAGEPPGPAPPVAGLLFRRGDRVRNAAGEEGAVVSDVKVGDTKMTVDIDGDYSPERVTEWRKI